MYKYLAPGRLKKIEGIESEIDYERQMNLKEDWKNTYILI